jgi:hypothetical protein
MGHYLSDLLPDPSVVCLNCKEGVWSKKTIQAWNGLLDTCKCDNPDHCNVEDVEVTGKPGDYKWIRKN